MKELLKLENPPYSNLGGGHFPPIRIISIANNPRGEEAFCVTPDRNIFVKIASAIRRDESNEDFD